MAQLQMTMEEFRQKLQTRKIASFSEYDIGSATGKIRCVYKDLPLEFSDDMCNLRRVAVKCIAKPPDSIVKVSTNTLKKWEWLRYIAGLREDMPEPYWERYTGPPRLTIEGRIPI